MNPGPHGPEPCRWRVLEYPVGAADVRLNSNCRALLSLRVLLDPPGAGNLCPGCAPAMVHRPVKSRPPFRGNELRLVGADPAAIRRTRTVSVPRGDVGHCPALEEVVFAEPRGRCQSHRSQAGRTIRPDRTALTALYAILAPGTLPGSFQAACRAAPLASAINSSTDHWS